MTKLVGFQIFIQILSLIVTVIIGIKDKGKNKGLIFILCILTFTATYIVFTSFINNSDEPITWKDKAFEKMVQTALNKEGEHITPKELENITSLCIIGDKVAYKDKSRDEFELSTNINNKEGYCKFKLKEEENSKMYYEKGDIICLDDIKYFKELRELYILLNKIEDMTPLENCEKLEYLWLDSNEIRNIKIPDSFKNLEYLSLGSNKINDISPLQSNALTNLTQLVLWNNEITNLDYLEKLINREKITHLNLEFNKIFEVPNFDDYKSLNSLRLSENYINDINNLSKLTSLTFLSLSNNKIEDINIISNLTSLKSLYLNKNNISNIDSIKNLDLNTLSISQNRLNTFPEDFKNKNCNLNVSSNYIKNKLSLRDFKNLTSDFSLFNVTTDIDYEANSNDSGGIVVNIDSLHNMKQAVYYWDNFKSNEIDLTSINTSGSFKLKVPSTPGKHELYIKVIDEFENETKGLTGSDGKDSWLKFSYTVS